MTDAEKKATRSLLALQSDVLRAAKRWGKVYEGVNYEYDHTDSCKSRLDLADALIALKKGERLYAKRVGK
jgi:hypothetical protein